MSKTILIARPHPFIVDTMKPFLEESGFVIRKLERTSDLPAQAVGVAGAVISLALSSAIAESAEDVFAQLRRTSVRIPVLFASMLGADQAHAALARIAQKSGFALKALDTGSPMPDWTRLGTQETFLYLSKDDLTTPERRFVSSQMIQRHFH